MSVELFSVVAAAAIANGIYGLLKDYLPNLLRRKSIDKLEGSIVKITQKDDKEKTITVDLRDPDSVKDALAAIESWGRMHNE